MAPNDDDLGIAPDPEASDRREPYVPDDYDDRPTAKQLAYLRVLAQRTGQTFAYPRTIFQASHEIGRLKRVTPSTRVDRTFERLDRASETAARQASCAVPVGRDEISGYGSQCTWSQRS